MTATALSQSSHRVTRPIALVLFGVNVLLSALYVVLYLRARAFSPQVFGFPGATAVGGLAFGSMGLLVVLRQRRNPLGWVMLVAGLLLQIVDVAQLNAIVAYRGGSADGLVAPLTAWLGSVLWAPGLALLPIGLLLFPDGHLGSRRWGAALVAVITLDALTIAALAALVTSTIVRGPVSLGADGQLSVLGAGMTTATIPGQLFVMSTPLLILSFVIGTVGLVVHTVQARGDRRQQMKWFASAAAFSTLALAAFVTAQVTTGSASVAIRVTSGAFVVALSMLPVATAVAILKYHLYDIDVVISRTLVYGSLAALITGVYVGIAVGIGELVGSGGKPNLGLSILATAIVALGFQPARERLQRVANRLVYGLRATPYQVLSEFSSQVAGSYAADEVLPRMARVLEEGTGSETATVWLRSNGELRAAATWPDPAGDLYMPAITVATGTLPALHGVTRAVEVRHQGELLGALSVVKRRGESLSPVEDKLLDDLAQQAGLVLKNVGLTRALQLRLEELRASRQRLVSAQDAERRRLERNLHDGAQQHLVALKVRLGLAEMLLSKDPDKAKQTLEQLKSDTDEALETLRDLARGIYPPLLAERGLASALESQARRAVVDVTIDAAGIGRYSQETEATMYFCVLEALQNVQKYAGAVRVVVRLRETGGTLRCEVKDDGRGFDVAHVPKGSGLQNMADRVDAAGGSLTIESAHGAGTTLWVTIPATSREAAHAALRRHA
ncbi:MAG: sensor histidine kinase [Candidatus Dormibacteraeota bacterium]|nr:sensor histidine kinase [Candidatus Dormibacteraeota bacterium]